jgi:hypothetical protein
MSNDARGKLTTAVAGVVLAGLPFLVNAQSTSTPQQPRTGTYASQQKPTTPTSAQTHLEQAKKTLDGINASSLKGDARTQFAEVKQHFVELERAWRSKTASNARAGATSSSHAGGHTAPTGGMTSGTPGATAAGTSGTPEQVGATGPTTRQTPARTGTMSKGTGDDEIMTHYNAIATLLDRLNPSASSMASDANADAATRRKLAEFRQHLDQFHSAAMSHPSGDAASASGSSSSYPSATTEASGAVAAGTASATPGAAQSPAPVQTGVNDAAIARLTTQLDELLSGGRPANSTVGTSGAVATAGTICVERAKLEQLRIDLQTLRGQPR